MPPTARDDTPPSGDWASEEPVSAHLASDESIHLVLTNREVGLRREDDDGTVQFPPGPDHGALAIMTDRRILFLVGDTPEEPGDLVCEVPYDALEDATAETEMLTQRVLVQTDSVTWSFTARETDTVDDVAAFLETATDVWTGTSEYIEEAERAMADLEAAVDVGDWDAADDALGGARMTIADANALLEDTPFDSLASTFDTLTATADALALARHRRHAEELADETESLLGDHEYVDAHDRLGTARHHVEAATELLPADDGASPADGARDTNLDLAVDATAVEGTRERVEALRTDFGSRPITDAEACRQRAAAAGDVHERVAELEDAFECYRAAAALFSDDDLPFEGDQVAAREDAEAVIADLIEAHHEAARTDRAAGEWERDAENHESAFELLTDATECIERALELARAYPPGDIATLEEEKERIQGVIDPLRIEVELNEAGE